MREFPKLRVYDPGQKALGGKSNMVYLKGIEQMDDGVYLRFERHLEDNENLKHMRGTGLKDKYGVEIYEGDIVLSSEYDKSFIIEYAEDWSCFAYDKPMNIIDRILSMDRACLHSEVIGNIYENPELLEV